MTSFIHSIPAWFELIFLCLCMGILSCRLWVLSPATNASLSLDENLLSRMWLLFGIGIAGITASGVADILVRAAEMSGKPLQAVLPVLVTVILKTHIGQVWLIRMAALILLSVAMITARRSRNSRAFPYLVLGFLLVISATESASGHASDAGDFSVAEIMDWLHLLGALVWGRPIALTVVILPHLVKQDDNAAQSIAVLQPDFQESQALQSGSLPLPHFTRHGLMRAVSKPC
jgi:putative copper resistance protein D